MANGRVTIARLVLLGTRAALDRHFGQAEVVFEYHSSEASIPHQHRVEYRIGIFGILDQLWDVVNLLIIRQKSAVRVVGRAAIGRVQALTYLNGRIDAIDGA
jgi:hypothetical protein